MGRAIWVVQSWTGQQYGWEDETAEESRAEGKERLKEYRENSPMPSRLVRRVER